MKEIKLTEKQLSEKLNAAKQEKTKRVSEQINEILKKENCQIKTEVDVVLNGRQIGIVVVAL